MREYLPLLIVGAIIGVFAAAFIIAYLRVRSDKSAVGFDRDMSDREIVRRLMKYAKPHAGAFALSFFIMLLSIGYEIASPLIVGRIEELITGEFELSALSRLVILYCGILLVSLGGMYGQSILLQKTGQKILSSLRADLFRHIESLDHATLNGIPVGTLVTRETNDTEHISRMFTNILVNLFKNILIVIAVLAAMFALNYELALMILCIAPVLVLFTVIFRKFARKAYRGVKDRTTALNIFLSENLSGIKITQSFNREDKKMAEFLERSAGLKKAKQRQIFVFSVFRPMVYMLYISSVLFLFYLGGRGVINGTTFLGQSITGATIVTFYMYTSKFFNPIQNLAEQFNMLQSAFASAEKIFKIFDISPAITDAPDAVDAGELKGEIEFKNVWFAYKEGEWVLKDVSFRVEAGQTVAFVGATGSGKSTILSLICRNYDIQKGQILIDGRDIKTYTIASLRRNFGQMLQDVFLFEGTVRSNIVLREEGFTDEQVEKACRYVNADKFLSKLSQGIGEPVRERGNNFSAGQRQLLSFARTILHAPRVMILDEATANIDTETELLIQDSLERMRSIGTMLIVAHRLSTIQHADKIIVLSHGVIKEQGTHKELLALHGRYHRLYTLQYEKERLAAGK